MKETQSAGAVVLNKAGKVLLVEQRGHVWSLPKGHLEGDEKPLDAAARELKEEAGISKFTFIRELGQYSRYKIGKDGKDDMSELKHMRFFLFVSLQEIASPEDPSITGAAWIDKKDVTGKLTHPKDREFFSSVLDKLEI